MKKHFSKGLSLLLSVLLLIYIGYHSFVLSGSSIATEQAIPYSASETLSVNAYIIHEETVIKEEYDGVLSYVVNDGAHIENSGIIANVYSDDGDIETKTRIDEIEKQLNVLEIFSSTNNGSVVVDLDTIDNQIDQQLIELLNSVESGSLNNADSNAEEYFQLLYRREAAIGSTTDFSEEINKLKEEKKNLEASLNQSATVLAPMSGYFVSSVDGYENVLNPEIIETLTPSGFDEIKPEEINDSESVIGKIVSGFNWYIATKMDFEDSLRFSIGDSYDMEIPVSSTGVVPVTVSNISKDAKDKTAVVVFKCSYMDSGLASASEQPVKIILNDYSGLRVPSNAIRTVDGKQGVYVLEASTVKFKPIKKVYSGNGYLICKRAASSTEGLFLYDDIIVKGKKLYDGKTITD